MKPLRLTATIGVLIGLALPVLAQAPARHRAVDGRHPRRR